MKFLSPTHFKTKFSKQKLLQKKEIRLLYEENGSSIATNHLTIKNDYEKHSEEIFRYACCHGFKYESARKAIKKTCDSPYLYLRMDGTLVEIFQGRIMMPLPGLRTKDNSQVIYIRASRYYHSTTSKQHFIDSLYYLLNDMSRTRDDCRGGVSIIANLRGYGVKNYDMDAILQAAKAVEGRLVPTRFSVLLYVDAPKIFMNGWKLLRPLLAPWLAKKVRFIKADQLDSFLMSGYKDFLPDEIEGGWKDTQELVDDYIDLKIYDERL